MPNSELSNISEIVRIISDIKPTTILDVGIGTGKYGLLFRDYLDGTWAGHSFSQQHTWTLNLIGIEIDESIITPVQKYIYNAIWIGDAFELLKSKVAEHCFDLVFICGLLEYMDREKGKVLLNLIKNNWLCPAGHIVVSTASYNYPPKDIKSQWYAQDFRVLGMGYKIIEGKYLTVVLQS